MIDENFNKKSKIFLSIFLLIMIVSVVVTYYKYILLKDFDISTDADTFNQSLLDK